MLKSALPCLLIGLPALVGINFVWPALQALHACDDAGSRLFRAIVERADRSASANWRRSGAAVRRRRSEAAPSPALFKGRNCPRSRSASSRSASSRSASSRSASSRPAGRQSASRPRRWRRGGRPQPADRAHPADGGISAGFASVFGTPLAGAARSRPKPPRAETGRGMPRVPRPSRQPRAMGRKVARRAGLVPVRRVRRVRRMRHSHGPPPRAAKFARHRPIAGAYSRRPCCDGRSAGDRLHALAPPPCPPA